MKTNPLFTPKSGRISLSLLAVVALLMALIMPALIATRSTAVLAQGTGQAQIMKTLVLDIGQQDTPMGRDTSLAGFEIDFQIFEGADATGTLVDTVTVTLGQNANGQGNVGNGSQGFALSAELEPGVFTVCEVPVATNPETGETVPLDAEPRPTVGEGGSTGGQQVQFGENCITFEIVAGEKEELKFLDEQVEEVPTEKPTEIPDNQQEEPTEQPKGEEPTEIPDNQQEEPKGEEPTEMPDNQQEEPKGEEPTEMPDNQQEGEKPDTGAGEMPDNQQEGEKPDTGAGETPDNQQEGETPDTGAGETPDNQQEGETPDTGAGETPDNQQGETPDEMPDTGAGGVAGAFPVATLGYLGGLLTLVGGSLMVRRKR